MTFRFIHAADIHLGNQQYGSAERYGDFARAFESLVADALERRVDAVLLAGDLFHKRAIGPETLLQAKECLERLKQARIYCIAIEGNHERAHFTESLSWLDYLAQTELLVTLTPDTRQWPPALPPWRRGTRQGAYIDLPGGVRVIGCKYYGASTPRVVHDLPSVIAGLPAPRPTATVLMLHAGLQGILDNYDATLTREDLEGLRPYVDYLALGHIHKPFSQDGWIYNPGSLETNSIDEADWDDRGYLLVEVDPARTPVCQVTPIHSQRRTFVRLTFPVDGIATPDALYERVRAYLGRQADEAMRERRPVVILTLTGTLAFGAADLELAPFETMLAELWSPVHAEVRDRMTSPDADIRPPSDVSRPELERFVLRQLVERDERHRADSDDWADLVLRLKEMSLAGSAPAEVIETLSAFRRTHRDGAAEAAAC